MKPMEANDTVYVKRVLSGDKAAFGPLVERHRPMALRLAARMLTDSAGAEDVTQEAFLQAFLSLDQLRDPERFSSWLYGITVNLCRMRLRARHEVRLPEDWDGGRVAEGFTWADAQPSAEAVYEIRELHKIVLSAVALLSPEQQAVVRLHYLDGLTLTEIGVLAGAPLGTIKARLSRARERLRVELTREFEIQQTRHPPQEAKMIEMIVHDVIARVRIQTGQPATDSSHRIILLKEQNKERILPIWVGGWEGDVIACQLAEKSFPRPVTFEFMARLLEAAQMVVERVAVTRLDGQVYYATLWARATDGKVQEIDARPSDAIALALQVKAPIFADEGVLEKQGVEPEKFKVTMEDRLRADHEALSISPEEAKVKWGSVLEHIRSSA
jgi:RNA polymerase sigma factor (sigma-70 family)